MSILLARCRNVSSTLLTTFIIILTWVITTTFADEEIGLCCLCDGCSIAIGNRGTLPVDEWGTTCDELILHMADPTNDSYPGSYECSALKSKFYRRCCDSKYNPPNIQQAPVPAPTFSMKRGDQPVCNVCPDGSYPGDPYTLVAVLQIPEAKTCDDLYEYGETGNIPEYLCNPLQDYYEQPCGCGKTPTNSNNGGGYIVGGGGGGGSGGGGGQSNGGGGDAQNSGSTSSGGGNNNGGDGDGGWYSGWVNGGGDGDGDGNGWYSDWFNGDGNGSGGDDGGGWYSGWVDSDASAGTCSANSFFVGLMLAALATTCIMQSWLS